MTSEILRYSISSQHLQTLIVCVFCEMFLLIKKDVPYLQRVVNLHMRITFYKID